MSPLVFSREELNKEMRDLYDLVGHETMARILSRFGGSSVYFPNHRRLGLAERDAMIREQFTGHNHKELALRFGLSDRHVRVILERGRKSSCQGVAVGAPSGLA